MKKHAKTVVLVLVLLLLVTFAVKNSQPVQLAYYFQMQTDGIPLYLLVYLCILLGVLVGLGAGYPQRNRLRKRVKALERETGALKAQSAPSQGPTVQRDTG